MLPGFHKMLLTDSYLRPHGTETLILGLLNSPQPETRAALSEECREL